MSFSINNIVIFSLFFSLFSYLGGIVSCRTRTVANAIDLGDWAAASGWSEPGRTWREIEKKLY